MKHQSFTNYIALLFIITAISSCSQSPTRQSDGSSQQPSQQTPSRSKPVSQKRNKVVQNAYQMLGSPYKFGGTTPRGFDCSGLTQHAYKASGITIPRVTGQQRDQSKTISSYSQVLPGDLIFFKTGRKTNHVGIYTGNGEFIHASTGKRRVVKVKLDTPYWRKHFVKFGTYISDK